MHLRCSLRMLVMAAVLGAPVVLSMPPSASASIVVRLDIDELTEHAQVIAVGRVLAADSHWTEDGMTIVTDVQLAVEEALKGTSAGAIVHFRVLGGTVDNLAQAVAGEPSFTVGERTLVFLEPRGDGKQLGVVGMSQGKYVVTTDAAGDEVVIQALGDLALADVEPAPGVAPGTPGPRVVTRIQAAASPPARPLAELVADIRGRVGDVAAP